MESEKKLDALKQLMKHYHSQDFQLNTSMIKDTMVYRLKVLEMTGQRSYTYSHGIKKNRMDFFHSILLFLTFFEHPVLLLLYHC